MSLRSVHITLILTSILLCFGFSYWCSVVDAGIPVYLSWVSLMVGSTLCAYLVWFIKKTA